MFRIKEFHIYEPSTEEDLSMLLLALNIFDSNISDMKARSDIEKYPIFKNFYDKHCVHRTYYFHVFKGEDESCTFHGPSKSGSITQLGDPVLVQGEDGYIPGRKVYPI